MRSDQDVERDTADRYTCPSRFEAEKRAVFRRLPLVVGRESELPETGRFFTHDAAGLPLLVTRDGAGLLRAMKNECTHRGTRLVLEERGSAESFVCALHAWRYDLRGQLARPGRASLPQALEESLVHFIDERALLVFPCESRHGFVWVVPASRTPLDVASWLGPALDAELGSLGVAGLVTLRRRSATAAGNWKHVVEWLLDGAGMRVVPLFPSSALVVDGAYVSHVAVFPAAVDAVTYVHTLLAPHTPETDADDEALEQAWGRVTRLVERQAPPRTNEAFHAALDRVLEAHAPPGAR